MELTLCPYSLKGELCPKATIVIVLQASVCLLHSHSNSLLALQSPPTTAASAAPICRPSSMPSPLVLSGEESPLLVLSPVDVNLLMLPTSDVESDSDDPGPPFPHNLQTTPPPCPPEPTCLFLLVSHYFRFCFIILLLFYFIMIIYFWMSRMSGRNESWGGTV